MKLQFKHQKFQADAAKAVVDVFAGQPYLATNYRIDNGSGIYQTDMETSFTGWRNEHIVPELNDSIILEHLQKSSAPTRLNHPSSWRDTITLPLRWKQVSAKPTPISRPCMS